MQPQADPFIVPLCTEQIEIVYRDESFLLIDKPPGLLSLSGKHPLNKDSVHWRLVQDFPTATLAHRLDFGTSGLMIVALNKVVNADITRQFQQRSVAKSYMALLHGHLRETSGLIDFPIAKNREHFPLQKICHETGKAALSHYRVVEYLDEPFATRVIFTPATGRTHQLRIHSREIGHPILGCDLYASDEAFMLASRLMLHAERIEFDHPVSGERFKGFCPSPF
ncbi:MAG: RluA family pseudouridine synthase [Gammaproteobacteria bacterium]|nr:RluA family pseudouridine synthase [Gammaproteobacteria bacterium]MBQ0839252.1 RluA family pseudouridine synthase [Gammaproteobacteria bacterium]